MCLPVGEQLEVIMCPFEFVKLCGGSLQIVKTQEATTKQVSDRLCFHRGADYRTASNERKHQNNAVTFSLVGLKVDSSK